MREVVCGVCGGAHPVSLTTAEQRCPAQNYGYRLVHGKVRTKRSRGDKRTGLRQIALRAYHSHGEELWEWTVPYDVDIEAKSGDEFALLIRDRRIAAFQNFTVCRAYVFSTRTVVPWRACLFLILVLCCFGFVRSKPANPEARAQDPRVVSPPKSNPLGGADFPSPFDEPSLPDPPGKQPSRSAAAPASPIGSDSSPSPRSHPRLKLFRQPNVAKGLRVYSVSGAIENGGSEAALEVVLTLRLQFGDESVASKEIGRWESLAPGERRDFRGEHVSGRVSEIVGYQLWVESRGREPRVLGLSER